MRFSITFEIGRSAKPTKRELQYAEADYKIAPYLKTKTIKRINKRKASPLAKKQLNYKLPPLNARVKRAM